MMPRGSDRRCKRRPRPGRAVASVALSCWAERTWATGRDHHVDPLGVILTRIHELAVLLAGDDAVSVVEREDGAPLEPDVPWKKLVWKKAGLQFGTQDGHYVRDRRGRRTACAERRGEVDLVAVAGCQDAASTEPGADEATCAVVWPRLVQPNELLSIDGRSGCHSLGVGLAHGRRSNLDGGRARATHPR